MSIANIFKILIYKLFRRKTIVINEAGGLGDYLWVRNYFKVIKSSNLYKDYKIIFCATKRWVEFAKRLDSNYVDVFLSFQNPYKPGFIEILALKLFKFDIFLNFRESFNQWKILTNSVKSVIKLTDKQYRNFDFFYPNNYNVIFSQLITLPNNFKHKLPINNEPKIIDKDYCVLNVGGYSQGSLTLEQLDCIIDNILINNNNLKILVLGTKNDIEKFKILHDKYRHNLLPGCGDYKTIELLNLINNAKFIVTVNTSIWHFAIQLHKPHIVFSIEENWIYDLLNTDYITSNKIKYIVNKESINHISETYIANSLKEFFENAFI